MLEFILGMVLGLLFALWVNCSWYEDSIESTDDWAQKCLEMNDDWADFAKKLIDENTEQMNEIAALKEQNETLRQRVIELLEEKTGDYGD